MFHTFNSEHLHYTLFLWYYLFDNPWERSIVMPIKFTFFTCVIVPPLDHTYLIISKLTKKKTTFF